ncbi:MAG TPA: hypothetical protein VJA20_01080, partial [Candidatus Nanoarchaeia archaeon]|nr:hypothetical protein [Candidatus Nanoarchaeia archaeon]
MKLNIKSKDEERKEVEPVKAEFAMAKKKEPAKKVVENLSIDKKPTSIEKPEAKKEFKAEPKKTRKEGEY